MKFDSLPDDVQEKLSVIAGNFTIRDGLTQIDGSSGTVRITRKELLSILAEAYITGKVP